MANHKSSIKRARQTIVINKRNREYLSAVKTKIKAFYQAIEEAKPSADVAKVFEMVQSGVAKAGQKGRIHKNNASRKISRLSAVLAKYQANPPKADDKPKKTVAKKATASKAAKKKAKASKIAKKKKAAKVATTASKKKKKVSKKKK